MRRKIDRFVIAGLGSIGRRHLRLLKRLKPESTITLVRSGKGGDWSEEALADHVVASIEDALEHSPDAAIIATPASQHLQQALQLAGAGVHLFIEKPVSVSADGVDALIDVVTQKRVKVLVGYVLRHDPAAQCFRAWLRGAEIGKVLHASIECGSFLPEWRPDQDYRRCVSASRELGGGVLLELSHDLDYLCWFFGRPREVQGWLANSGILDIDVEDQADLIVTNADGVPIHVHLDFNRRRPTRRCVVQTSEGELAWDGISKQVAWRKAGSEPRVQGFPYGRDELYRRQLKHFIGCVEEDREPAVSLADGLMVLQLIDAARQADASGCKMSLS